MRRSWVLRRRAVPTGLAKRVSRRHRRFIVPLSILTSVCALIAIAIAIAPNTFSSPTGPNRASIADGAALASTNTSWSDQLAGVRLRSISCADRYHCVTVGAGVSGGLAALETTDQGLDWTHSTFPTGTTGQFYGVSCADTVHCWAVGQAPGSPASQIVYTTSNGGLTWTNQTANLPNAANGGTLYALSCLAIGGSYTCVAVGGSGVTYRTTNGGLTWTQTNLSGSHLVVSCVNASSALDCWTSSGTTIYESTNSGSTWTSQAAPANTGSITGFSCVTATVCFASGTTTTSTGAIFELSSGAWSTVWTGWASMASISCPATNTCVTSGSKPFTHSPAIYSALLWNGSTGTQLTIPAAMAAKGIDSTSCPTTNVCVGVGQEGVTATQNGGSTWTQMLFVPLNSTATSNLACTSNMACVWAPGDETVYWTTDQGSSWQPKSLPTSVTFLNGGSPQTDGPIIGVYALACGDSQHCAIAVNAASPDTNGTDPMVLTTANGGTSWTEQWAYTSWYSLTVTSIACPPSGTWCLWLGQGYTSHPFATGGYVPYPGGSVSGLTVPSNGAVGWNSLACPGSSTCTAAGLDGSNNVVVAKTTNGGSSWAAQTPASGFPSGTIPQISCGSTSACIVVGGSAASVMQTTNGGSSWSMVTTMPTGSSPTEISCGDATHCVARGNVTGQGIVFISTTNGGSSWTTTAAPTPSTTPEAVTCADATNCWATGYGSTAIALYATNGVTAPIGGAISLGEAFGGLDPAEPCFSCELKSMGAAAQAFVGEPVNTATGDFYESLPLFSLPGRGIPVAFNLTYDASYAQSQVEASAVSPGPDGWGWTDNYSGLGVSVDPSSDVATVTQENGSQIAFTPSTISACSSTYSPLAPRITATLACSTGGGTTTYTLTRNGGLDVLAFSYNASSQLTEATETDANGLTTTILYGQQGSNSSGANYNAACPASAQSCTVVTDPASRAFVLAYNASGQLAEAADPVGATSGHTWSFAYDANGNLSSVTDRAGQVTSFAYDASNATPAFVHDMTTLTPPNGQTGGPDAGKHWTIAYDTLGRVTSQSDPASLTTTFAYAGNNLSDEGGTTTITDPHGNVTVQTYAYGVLSSSKAGVNGAVPATWTYVRDPSSLMPTSVIDPNGHTTTATYDASGNPLTVSDALNHTTTSTFNTLNEPTKVVDPVGIETDNTYDASGNLTSKVVKGVGGPTVTLSNTVCETGCPSGYVKGDVESTTDPNTHTTTFTYDAYGDLASSSITVGSQVNTTSNSYDLLGQRYCEVSPNANAASVTCPAFGQPAVADTSNWTYDANGRLSTATDADGNTTTYAYDGDGNQTQVTDALGNVTKTAYDADDRVASTTAGYGTSSASTNSTTYDIVPASCPTAPTGTTWCVQVSNGLSQVTTNYYDALGYLIEQAPPSTTAQAAASYTYDGLGNTLSKADGAGTTSYSYDAANRLAGIAYSSTASGYTQPHAVSYSYDADGRRTQMVDGTGTTTYVYDGLERLDQVTNGAGAVVTYGYDSNGNRTCLNYPNSGSTTCQNASSGTGLVSYSYDAANRVTAMSDWLSPGGTTNFTYDNDSNLLSTTLPTTSAVTVGYSYDNADNLTGISVSGLVIDPDNDGDNSSTDADSDSDGNYNLAQLTRNADNQVATTTPSSGSGTTYGYDPLNRVTGGVSASYTYDAASQLTSVTPTGGSTSNDGYNADGQLCWSGTGTGTCSSPPSGATTYGYDATGDRLNSTPAGASSTTYGWDQAGRLTCLTAPNPSGYSCSNPNSSVTATYVYDGDGLRSSDTPAGGSSQSFTWDPSGSVPNLLADGTSYYLYGPSVGSTPLEQISISGASPSFLASDTTGVRLAVASSGTVSGWMSYDSYGTASTSGSTTTPFGFEGGYTDASGLIYLIHRYYDPATGQFLSVDPALLTTRQPYEYTGGDPVNGSDPSGMLPQNYGGGPHFTIQDVMNNPGILEGLTPTDVQSALQGTPGWEEGVLAGSGPHAGQGWALRELRSTDAQECLAQPYTGRQVLYEPPYPVGQGPHPEFPNGWWKISTGTGSPDRFQAGVEQGSSASMLDLVGSIDEAETTSESQSIGEVLIRDFWTSLDGDAG